MIAKSVIANRFTLGDSHDQSVESFISKTDYLEYQIFCLSNGKFRVNGLVPDPIPVKSEKPPIVKKDKKKKRGK